MIIETKVLKAISETMTCEKCPYPCKSKQNNSLANCVMRWSEILSQINPDADWKEIRYKVFTLFE